MTTTILLNKEKKNHSIPYDKTRLKRILIKTGLQHWVCRRGRTVIYPVYLFSGQAS